MPPSPTTASSWHARSTRCPPGSSNWSTGRWPMAESVADVAVALADGIEAALPRWVERSVDTLVRLYTGAPPSDEVAAAAREAGRQAQADLGPRVRAVLEADVGEQ